MIRRSAIAAIRLYRALAPLARPLWIVPTVCRHVPSCSEYAEQAIRERGVLRGLWAAAVRVLHCQPFSAPGYSPVEPHPPL